MNHDALFKLLLKTPVILRGFFEAFVPEAGPFIDFRVLEFVDKERTTLDGRKRTGDPTGGCSSSRSRSFASGTCGPKTTAIRPPWARAAACKRSRA